MHASVYVATMSRENSKSEASSLQETPQAKQLLDDMLKLDPAESLTTTEKESGLGAEMTNPSPIVPEQQAATTSTDNATTQIYVPSSTSRQKPSRKKFKN